MFLLSIHCFKTQFLSNYIKQNQDNFWQHYTTVKSSEKTALGPNKHNLKLHAYRSSVSRG